MEQIIESEGYNIFVKTQGEGPPVLLLHSYLGSLNLFDDLANELSKNRTVIRIDLPGHGDSSTPPSDYRFDAFAGAIAELLQKLNIAGKIALIGHSMGGYIAMAFADRFPERIESLILIHSPIRSADDLSIKSRNREATLLRNGKKDLLLQVTIPSNFAPELKPETEGLVALIHQTARQVTTDGALRSIEAMNHRCNSLKTLQNEKYPILIIIGKHDNVYSPETQLEDALSIPRAEVLLLGDSGHMGFMEEPEIVLSSLLPFLS